MDDSIREKKDNNLQFGHVIDGYLRSDYNRGTDYFVDVRFESKFQNISHQVRAYLKLTQLIKVSLPH